MPMVNPPPGREAPQGKDRLAPETGRGRILAVRFPRKFYFDVKNPAISIEWSTDARFAMVKVPLRN